MKKLLFILLLISGLSNAQIINFTDPNFKAALLNSPANGVVKNASDVSIDIDTNNDNEIQQSEALLAFTIDLTQLPSSLPQNINEIGFFTNLKTLKAQFLNMPTFDASNNINLDELSLSLCGIQSINLTTNLNLKKLVLPQNLLTSINLTNNINLEFISIGSNYLTSLNTSTLVNLKTLFIDTQDQDLASLNLSTNTNLEVLILNNNLNIAQNIIFAANYPNLTSLAMNNVGTINNLNFLITMPNLSILSLNNNLGLANINLVPYTLNNLDSLYLINNNISSFSRTQLPLNSNNLNTIELSSNPLTILNLFNLPNLNLIKILDTNLETIDFSSLPNLNNFYASDNPLLKYLIIKNGTNTLGAATILDIDSSTISNCPLLQYVCIDDGVEQNLFSAFLLEYGGLLGTTNASNIVTNTYCTFTPGGNYNTITGVAKYDDEANGCDTADDFFDFLRVNINDGTTTGSTFTNQSGNYNFYTQEGNFTLTPQLENPTYFAISPTTVSVGFANNNNNTNTQNFCITPNGVHQDVEVVIAPYTPARPGFDAEYIIAYKNKGNQTLSGTINLAYEEAVLDFVSATQTTTAQTTGSLSWNYNNLLPFENRSFIVKLNVNSPMETPAVNIGDQLDFTVAITPIVGDEIPSDNTFEFKQIVVGSYDPNDITCLEGAVVSPSEIGNYLHYIVNFENTGTFAAENVVVKVVIDVDQFDINTLQLLNASHPIYIRITGNIVEFIFENINLASGGGHGNILMKIKTKSILTAGDVVSKRADIFFDYNFPIDTGLANTTFALLSNGNFIKDNSIKIYPNPTQSVVNISGDFTIKSVQLFDVQGRILHTQLINELATTINISDKANGIYLIKITSEKGSKVEKIMKE